VYAGIDSMRFLKTKDGMERLVMQLIAQEAHRIRQREDLHRAQVQANEIGRLFRT